MLRFDERDPAHYRLFNVRSLLAPAGSVPPDFLKPEASMGRFQVWSAPGSGYFDVVDVTDARPTTRESFYEISDAWLHGDGFANGRYLRLDFHGEAATDLPQVPAESGPPGRVVSERYFEATVEASRPAFVLFRMTWHPNWQVSVDGRPVKTAMLTPGFLGVPVAAGTHEIAARYEPGNGKILMAVGGLAAVVLLCLAEWRKAR
jgi:hypothetical protein